MITLHHVLEIHQVLIKEFGGIQGVRDSALLEAAINRPYSGFGDNQFYPNSEARAAAIVESVVKNHPFIDGNKRAGHAAMETFLMFNGYEISSGVDEQTEIVLGVASGRLDRSTFTRWLQDHIVELS